jgi:hypothetical protein
MRGWIIADYFIQSPIALFGVLFEVLNSRGNVLVTPCNTLCRVANDLLIGPEFLFQVQQLPDKSHDLAPPFTNCDPAIITRSAKSSDFS